MAKENGSLCTEGAFIDTVEGEPQKSETNEYAEILAEAGTHLKDTLLGKDGGNIAYLPRLQRTQLQVYERLREGLEQSLLEENKGESLLSKDLQIKLITQLRSFMYASRGIRVPDKLVKDASPFAQTRDSGDGAGEMNATLSKESCQSFVNNMGDRLDTVMKDKMVELKNIPESLPIHVHREALLEMKKLKLVSLQRKLRLKILAEKVTTEDCSIDTLFDHSRLSNIRVDISSLTFDEKNGQVTTAQMAAMQAAALAATRAAKAEERAAAVAAARARIIEAQRIAEEERRKKQEEFERSRRQYEAKMRVIQHRKKFLQDLTNHREELRKNHFSDIRKSRKQRCEHTLQWHSKERKKKVREANARVLALRTDNIEEYLKMVKEAKNSRVGVLLENTEVLLVELGMKVADQRAAVGADEVENVDTFVLNREVEGEKDMADNLLAGQKKYLGLVHKKKEHVDEQPSLLLGGQLRSYQLAGLQWMVSLYINGLNGILADEMGLGKTIQSVSLFAYLMEKKSNFGPHLVICPKAVLSNWTNEFQKWLPSLNIVLYDGNPVERKALREEKMAAQTFNVLLTHYDMIMRDKKVLTKYKWEYILIDEGHRLKNKDSKLSEVLRGMFSSKYRLLLTGTPIQNNLKELWALLNFVLPKVFDTSDSFDDWFAAPFKGTMEDITLSEEEELLIIHRLHQVIRPFLLRRKKSEVEKELPNKSEVILKCDLSAWQKTYYKQITMTGSVMLETPKGNSKSRTLMNSAMQLRKACIHPYLFLDSMIPPYEPEDPSELIRASGKFELLDRILPKLKRTGHRVLLFSQMTRGMDLLEYYLEMKGFNYLRLDGETKTHERPLLLAEFNRPNSEIFIFILSTRAGGLGLNLQTADTVILFDSDWNPQMDKQAEDRAHRIGQKKEVKIITLVTVGSIEEVILERARQKADIDNKVIQAGMFNQTSSHHERHETLSALFKRGIQDIGKGTTDDDTVNQLIARSEEEIAIFSEMDAQRYAESKRPSLMQDDEVPTWATNPPEEEENDKKEDDGVLQPRRAKTKQVVYDDGLTDKMWTRLVDDGMNVEKASEARIQKLEERRQRKLKKVRDLDEASKGNPVSSSDENGDPVKRGRGRPRKQPRIEEG